MRSDDRRGRHPLLTEVRTPGCATSRVTDARAAGAKRETIYPASSNLTR
jgi:hypothetical protein